MNDINIPISAIGAGSQPLETDGAEMDILQMPAGMDSYAAPLLPEPEEVTGLSMAKSILFELLSQLKVYQAGMPVQELNLTALDEKNRELVDQVLGEGEVSVILSGRLKARVQESVLAGVWRVKYLNDDDELIHDVIEVAPVPSLVIEKTFVDAENSVADKVDKIPDGVLNAPPLIAEINDKVAEYHVGDEAYVINLTLLPQTEQDLLFLAERLGTGTVTILSRGYGNCRITSTATNNVWWVQYFNSQDKNILNSLEITQVPNVACAAPEDLQDSAERLTEIMEMY